jgi:hypothetical protein
MRDEITINGMKIVQFSNAVFLGGGKPYVNQ